MVKFLDFLTVRLKPYTYQITAAIVFIIFAIVGYLTFTSIMKKNNGPNSDFNDVANNGSALGDVEVKFFFVDWCPYCKNAMPEWEYFCDEYNGKNVNNYKISCFREGTNCTNDENTEVKTMIAKYKIESFPTVILFKDDKRYDFDAKVTKNALEQFVETVTTS